MPRRFHGQEREALLDRLVNEWLPGDSPVAILQGFPGCGKSQLAREVAEKAAYPSIPVEPQADSADPVQDLFLDLAIALEQNGLPRLAQEFDKGAQANFSKALLETLRRDRVLIVVDEFQRLFPREATTPPASWRTLVEQLSNSPKPQGRLVLISNRSIKTERWSENCRIEEVHALADTEAEVLFSELLDSSGLTAKVPQEQRRTIAHRLGGNPRALKTLVGSLRTDSLDDLLSTAPDLLKPGDVVLDPQLVEEFERELLERALPKLEADLLKFMRWLSVHRRPFRKEALAQFTGGRESPETLRKQLFDRFLLEQAIGGDVPHPLAREICVSRLRAGQGEWVQAHRLAANYHMRHFKARQLTGSSTLAGSFAELRHHLYEAGSIGELREASERLIQFLLSQIGLVTPVPKTAEALEERIALLSAVPDERRPRVLEYQLARCLAKRGAVGDKERALNHARKGTGRHPHSATWILRLNLEFELHGIDIAVPVIDEALRSIGVEGDVETIYQRGAELLAKVNRSDDAIRLLEKGIAVPGMASQYILYQSVIQLADTAGDFAKAEAMATKGLAAIPKTTFGRNRVAETALRIFAARNNTEALHRFQALSGVAELEGPQRVLADYLLTRISGNWERAIQIVHQGLVDFPNYAPLRSNEVDARLALGQLEEAAVLMSEYRFGEHQQGRDNPVVWFKAYVSVLAGRATEAVSHAAMYAPNDFDPGRPLDEAELMRLWTLARNGMNEPMAATFPGLAEFQRRKAPQAQTGQSFAAETPKQLCVLAVATEWDSRHGGLSTFNRDLCAALGGAGARVVCYVPQANADEIKRAKAVGVHIVEAPKMPGAKDVTLLFQRPNLPSAFVPDIVIGHDRITGAASVTLARDHYQGSKRVLFIHTSPEEIEWHKEARDDSSSAGRAADRKREQLDLADGCSLVVAVGPHLAAEFGTDLHGVNNRVKVMELTPGLPESFAAPGATLPPTIRCLILGRVEDYTLKGLDISASSLGRVVANWKHGNAPKLIVRGAPLGTDAALRKRLGEDSAPTELDIVVRHYSADETEIRSDLREASLVLMPSRKEGFGLVGLEAIACGVPTLVSDQSGLAETLRHYAPQVAYEWILPVTGEAVAKWAERMELFLAARAGAFARAAVLREQLAAELDWHREAVTLLDSLYPTRDN